MFHPRINDAAAHTLEYPGGRQAAVILSADLELAWAWRYARAHDPLTLAREKARQGRHNLPLILELCDRYDVPVTWATVGHIMLTGCHRTNGACHRELPRVPHFQNDWWSYRAGDWYDHDPACASAREAEWSDWCGPDLVERILGQRAVHEIGCHTFSHIPMAEEHCPAEVAEAELRACQDLADRWGVKLRSFVFPGNLSGNASALGRADYSIYRCPTGFDLDVPHRDQLGLWRIHQVFVEESAYAWNPAEQARLLHRYVDLAIERGLVCSFWFHPETEPEIVETIFPSLFEHIERRRSELWVTTMGDLGEWMNAQRPTIPAVNDLAPTAAA
jgi:peptidoglycan/xylan/chitin deacetylase (PgdA/CDA1 family)